MDDLPLFGDLLDKVKIFMSKLYLWVYFFLYFFYW